MKYWDWDIDRGIRLKCYHAFFLVCCGYDNSYIVSVHIQCQASIYTLSLCRGHSWRVRLAKQETLTPPGHLVLPLVCRGPWMSTVVLYCWCRSDGALVLLYFTYNIGTWEPTHFTYIDSVSGRYSFILPSGTEAFVHLPVLFFIHSFVQVFCRRQLP